MGRQKKIRYTPQDENPQLSLMPEYDFDFVDTAVERVKVAWMLHHHMNPDGKPMLLAYSGGKDSTALFFVAKKAAEEKSKSTEEVISDGKDVPQPA